MIRSGTIHQGAGLVGVHIDGLDELMKGLKEFDNDAQRNLRKALKSAVQPVLTRARANASAIADDGTFAASLSLGSRKNGALWVLRSTDPAAGVKEFAHHGARYVPKPDTKLRNARKMATFPVGVPRGNPPRAIIPAVNDSVEEIEAAMMSAIEKALDEAVARCRAQA